MKTFGVETEVDTARLRVVAIAAPVVFLVALELISIFVLRPVLGDNSLVRLLIIFAVLAVAAIAFAFWVFGTIDAQQEEIARSAALLDSVQAVGIFMTDVKGIVLSWSRGAERVTGYTAEEMIGRHISGYYPAESDSQATFEAKLAQVREKGRAESEGWRVRKDGSRFWAEVISTAIADDQGDVIAITHVTRDVTDRMLAEERIRALNEELGERVAELDAANQVIARHNRQLEAVNTAIRAISSAIDLSHVLQNITDAARRLVGSEYAALGVSTEKGMITQFITSGITTEQRAAIGPLPQGHGLLGALITEGEPMRVPDISKDPRSHGFPPNHPPMTSLLGVPILLKEKAVGDLYLTDKIGASEFSQEDQDLLILLASHAAVAIENARLYEEARSSRDRLQLWNEELEATVAERTREIERYSKEITTRVLQAQEEERKRIARELHDDTAQSLSTMLIALDLLEPQLAGGDPILRAGFERVRALGKRTLDETRALSHDLRPTILDDFGLVAALRWFAEEFTTTFGVPVQVDTATMPEDRLSPEIELALFRIAQEALTNSGKYARASEAHVRLTFPDSAVQLVVEDDGQGFVPDKVAGPTRQGGLGLYGMRERADLLGATLTIDSSPGQGTRITVTAPLNGVAPIRTAATKGDRS